MTKYKEARDATGLSQAKLAKMLEVPLKTYINWETAQRTPPTYVERLILKEIYRIADEINNK